MPRLGDADYRYVGHRRHGLTDGTQDIIRET